MKQEEKTLVAYEAPRVEVIEVEVEKGFTVSDPRSLEDTSWS